MSFTIQQGLFRYDISDRYAILGVPLDAKEKEIRKRYLKIAYLLHPDTCKARSDAEKQQANQLLSKLVNPAYEGLSKEVSRTEYLLILSQMGKKLKVEGAKITLAGEPAKKLSQAIASKVDSAYKELWQSIAVDQYSSLDRVLSQIAQLSELNLVYLILKEGQGIQGQSANSTARQTQTVSSAKTESEPTTVSPIDGYIRRAQDCLNKNNFAQAIVEMKDAIKIAPTNSTCLGLMGLAYLKQNQTTMAKVYIDKAWQSNPKDPVVITAKQEFNKLTPNEPKIKSASASSGSSNSGFLSGLFGKKK